VYVYDLGPGYTDGVQKMEPWWYAEASDVERLVTEALLSSNQVRTTNPDEASLFFVPFYSARYGPTPLNRPTCACACACAIASACAVVCLCLSGCLTPVQCHCCMALPLLALTQMFHSCVFLHPVSLL